MLIEDVIANARQSKYRIFRSWIKILLEIKFMMITGGFNPPQPFSNTFLQRIVLLEAPTTPITPGEQEISVTAHIAYLLR